MRWKVTASDALQQEWTTTSPSRCGRRTSWPSSDNGRGEPRREPRKDQAKPEQRVGAARWTEWRIPLTSFTGVNLAKVKKITLGVGDRADPKPGGAGRIIVDDIYVRKSTAQE